LKPTVRWLLSKPDIIRLLSELTGRLIRLVLLFILSLVFDFGLAKCTNHAGFDRFFIAISLYSYRLYESIIDYVDFSGFGFDWIRVDVPNNLLRILFHYQYTLLYWYNNTIMIEILYPLCVGLFGSLASISGKEVFQSNNTVIDAFAIHN